MDMISRRGCLSALGLAIAAPVAVSLAAVIPGWTHVTVRGSTPTLGLAGRSGRRIGLVRMTAVTLEDETVTDYGPDGGVVVVRRHVF